MKTTNWNSLSAFFSSGDDSGHLRLSQDGDSAEVVFIGDPKTRSVHWVSGVPTDCSGTGCVLCRTTGTSKKRITIDVAMLRDGMWIPKSFEQAVPFFVHLRELDKTHPVGEWLIRVTRRGGAGDRNTRYEVVPVRQLTSHELTVLDRFQAMSASDPGDGDPGA